MNILGANKIFILFFEENKIQQKHFAILKCDNVFKKTYRAWHTVLLEMMYNRQACSHFDIVVSTGFNSQACEWSKLFWHLFIFYLLDLHLPGPLSLLNPAHMSFPSRALK